MTLFNHIRSKLEILGVNSTIDGKYFVINDGEATTRIRGDDDLEQAYIKYKHARTKTFSSDDRIFVLNNSVECQLIRLSQEFARMPQYVFNDSGGNSVTIANATPNYSIGFLDSTSYDNYFNNVLKKRLMRLKTRNLSYFLWSPLTATFSFKGRKTPANLLDISKSTIKSVLFKLAVEQHECYELWKPRNHRLKTQYHLEFLEDYDIPSAHYDEGVVSYYKVAKSSPFPSQSFLAYYNVLEYYFLSVSEDSLHYQLRTFINRPDFRADEKNLGKLISVIRGKDAKREETEMLRGVIERFVSEGDLIDFIKQFEVACGETVYTKRRPIFGENIGISLQEGHIISNVAKALKHVRNAIVHSSDKYKREECHIPLSDSEAIIEEFLPLVRFLSEKVIYGTAM